MGTHPIFESDFDCLTELKMSFSGAWKKSASEGGEAFFTAFDPKPEVAEKMRKAALAEMVTTIVDDGASITMSRVLSLDGNSKNLPENKLVFGQECELTGPMGRTFKCTPTRAGDVITMAAAGVDIKFEISGGNFVGTYSGKGNTFTRTSS